MQGAAAVRHRDDFARRAVVEVSESAVAWESPGARTGHTGSIHGASRSSARIGADTRMSMPGGVPSRYGRNELPSLWTGTSRGVAARARVWQCAENADGVFLDRSQLGSLIEAEHDWHTNAGQHTAPMPRITPDMTAPPAPAPRARAWVETLF